MKKTDTLDLSLPQSRMVRGYEIIRAPLGAFLNATRQIQDFPVQLLEAVFPQKNLEEVLQELKSCDSDMVERIFVRAVSVVPEQAICLVAGLTGIAEEKLKSDPQIGLDGFAEIVSAWLEVNRIGNFTRTAAGIWKTLRPQKAGKANIGSKG